MNKTKVVGIGWAKTGTTTLGECLKILGYNHQSQNLDLVKYLGENNIEEIMQIADQKDSFEDWPWLIMYKEFDKRYPDSKFILTKRDSEKWLKSYDNMLARQGEASKELNKIRQILYGLPFPNVTQEELVRRYENHLNDVQNYFQDRPNQLLVLDWEKGNGWKELCRFLGKPVPSLPFPHANKGLYSQMRKSSNNLLIRIKAIVNKITQRN